MAEPTASGPLLLKLTAQLVTDYVSHNSLKPSELLTMIADVHSMLHDLANPPQPGEVKAPPVPAVPIRNSLRPDYLVCLEDGRKYKSLKRHLSAHGMTPEDYRKKWGLPPDYPMVAPNYSAARADIAKSIGLGRERGVKARRRRRVAV